jgi:hypothetical protein
MFPPSLSSALKIALSRFFQWPLFARRGSRLEVWSNRAAVPGVAIYLYGMVIFPLGKGNFSWEHLHAVWETWQTFNAAVLAFFASVIALNVSRISEEKQRERDFLAARAFLPAAFSDLTAYFKACGAALTQVWDGGTPVIVAPTPPNSHREAFKECIRHATPEIGEQLTAILVKLQVHEARLQEVVEKRRAADKYSVLSYLFSLAEMKVRVDKLFDFARGEALFDQSPMVWANFKNAYSVLDLDVEHYEISAENSLQALTQRLLKKRNA